MAGTAPAGSVCAPRFTYEGVWYEGCTLTNNPRPWCSLTEFYNGLWGVCGGKVNVLHLECLAEFMLRIKHFSDSMRIPWPVAPMMVCEL